MSELGEKVIAAVRDKAAQMPQFVYRIPSRSRSCRYMHDGKPSCIVGHALATTGMISRAIEGSSRNTKAIDDLALSNKFDQHELHWLKEVQLYQDTGWSWSDSVIRADEYVKL